MKKNYFLLLLIIIICSCSKNKMDNIDCPHGQNIANKFSVYDKKKTAVSKKDLDFLLSTDVTSLKSGLLNYDISVYQGEDNDTLLYIVNFRNGGWRIYSSDKRTPAVLAEGEKGSFSLDEGSPAVAVWINCMSKDATSYKKALKCAMRVYGSIPRANHTIQSNKAGTLDRWMCGWMSLGRLAVKQDS